MGFAYAGASGNTCPDARIVPLTSDRAGILDMIDDLEGVGSTAGQIGASWGWYTVSPNFNSLWPSSAAGAYGDPDLLKAAGIAQEQTVFLGAAGCALVAAVLALVLLRGAATRGTPTRTGLGIG